MTYPLEVDAWIVRVAKNMTITQPELTEDLAQEGRVAAWKAWTGHNMPEDVGYAQGAARRRMIEVVMGRRRMLGSDLNREKIVKLVPVDPVERSTASALTPLEKEMGKALGHDENFADYVMLSYHHGEIYDAICSLPPGQQQAALCTLRDEPRDKSAWRRAKPKLAAKLQHLRELT